MNEIQAIKQKFEIIGNTPALNRALDIAKQVAPTDLSVLITGESGVGKEVFPRIIHSFSARKHAQYIAVNCGAIPEGTIDSELFGHEKGAFTGAVTERKGYFEVTDGGTIFLDEVGELPLPTQARLLRVLETGEFMRVGSSKVQKTNVRVIAATNIDFPKAVKEGKFREDLYYRLNTIPIHIPSLRERPEDIPLLFRKFAADFAEKYRMPAMRLDASATNLLMEYRWPGNVRQLKNITKQVSILEQERELDALTLQKYLPNMEQQIMLSTAEGSGEQSYASEREILYKILFDMKKDMNDLKRLVYGVMQGNEVTTPTPPAESNTAIVLHNGFTPEQEFITTVPTSRPTRIEHYQETTPYVEESFSLEQNERELIDKALQRHAGKRKAAANELGISERTLYRKLKEYSLD
ncbi:MAG: sigma-54 interaction domain-containing protein [Marinifilaceae bacterium]